MRDTKKTGKSAIIQSIFVLVSEKRHVINRNHKNTKHGDTKSFSWDFNNINIVAWVNKLKARASIITTDSKCPFVSLINMRLLHRLLILDN